jgi:HEAT repeat protein
MLGKRTDVLSFLYEQLNDKLVLWETKSRILHGIGYIGDKKSIETLISFSNAQEYDYLNIDIVYALGYILDKDMVNPLYRITADSNFHINLQIINHIFMSRPD